MDRREFMQTASGLSAAASLGSALRRPDDGEDLPLRVLFDVGVERSSGAPAITAKFCRLLSAPPKSLRLRTVQASMLPAAARALRAGVAAKDCIWRRPGLALSVAAAEHDAAAAFLSAHFKTHSSPLSEMRKGEDWFSLIVPVEVHCTEDGQDAFLKLLDRMLADVAPEHEKETWITLSDYVNGNGLEGHIAYPWSQALRPERKHAYYRIRKGRVQRNDQCCIV